jgi:pilus assembly protein CpaD
MTARDRKDSQAMHRLTILAAVAALTVGAAACAPSSMEGLTAVNNPSLSSVHQPVVQRTDFVLDLATSGGRVPTAELDRLDAWLASIDVGYGDRISIDEPRGYPMPGARADVASVAAEYGLLLNDGAPVLSGVVPPGSLRVVATRATASVPGCPVWQQDGVLPSVNTSANFGCASNSNLAAMIADPQDLVHGRDATTAGSATTAGRAIRTYREREPTGRQGLPATSTTGDNQ